MKRLTRKEIKDILRTQAYPPGTAFKISEDRVMIISENGSARVGIVCGTTITWGTEQYYI